VVEWVEAGKKEKRPALTGVTELRQLATPNAPPNAKKVKEVKRPCEFFEKFKRKRSY